MTLLPESPARRLGALALGLLTLAWCGAALAQPKISIGCTSTGDCASAMIAVDEGIFAKHGLDASMVRIGINSNIPAAILSDSIQFGGPTETVFLQAVDGGLDLVTVAGASSMDPIANHAVAAYARKGVSIHSAQDFVGKKVGAPGIGAFLQVLFVKWLMEKGVDPKSVHFVEVTFPTMNDTLKSGSVDAVLTAEPFITRMDQAGTGYVAARYAADLNRTEPIISYVASRAYAQKNPEVIKAFRASIIEAAAIVNGNRQKASEAIARFTKLPLPIILANRPSLSTPDIQPSQLVWWLDVMKQQDMLQTTIDPAKIVLQ